MPAMTYIAQYAAFFILLFMVFMFVNDRKSGAYKARQNQREPYMYSLQEKHIPQVPQRYIYADTIKFPGVKAD